MKINFKSGLIIGSAFLSGCGVGFLCSSLKNDTRKSFNENDNIKNYVSKEINYINKKLEEVCSSNNCKYIKMSIDNLKGRCIKLIRYVKKCGNLNLEEEVFDFKNRFFNNTDLIISNLDSNDNK